MLLIVQFVEVFVDHGLMVFYDRVNTLL
jgi:hypothetical protein